jgi:hypothetical protein
MSNSAPLSPDVYDESEVPIPPTNPSSTTRTVAIIKHHALNHRFDIERRIQEASFEVRSHLHVPESKFISVLPPQIVKERQMEFDVETDPETLYELFGEDADSLGE